MRFMVMHKHDKTTEAGVKPTLDFIAAMGGLVEEMIKKGVFKDGAGLGTSATRTRLTFRGGERTVLEGPYEGSGNELVAGYMQLKTASRAEAVEWASRLGRILGDVEIEVGKTTEAWDLGLAPEPPNPPFQCLVLVKATPESEAGKAPSAAVRTAIAELAKEMTAQGILMSSGTLTPSAKGSRIHMGGGKRSIVDGPFAESKELIGGFALLDLPSKEAVIEFCWRYGDLMLKSVEKLELDIRPVLEDGVL